jgi:hypothetical protein
MDDPHITSDDSAKNASNNKEAGRITAREYILNQHPRVDMMDPKTGAQIPPDLNLLVRNNRTANEVVRDAGLELGPRESFATSIQGREIMNAIQSLKKESHVVEIEKLVHEFSPRHLLEKSDVSSSVLLTVLLRRIESMGKHFRWCCAACHHSLSQQKNGEWKIDSMSRLKEILDKFRAGKFARCGECKSQNFFFVENNQLVFACIPPLGEDFPASKLAK